MWERIVASFYFSNWFLGILAISLSAETCFQLKVPLNSPLWYVILCTSVVIFYTWAYISGSRPPISENPRTNWYQRNLPAIKITQTILIAILIISATAFLTSNYPTFIAVPKTAFLPPLIALLAAISYYGYTGRFNLRFAGWTKPVTIGFCWAVTVGYVPLIALQTEGKTWHAEWVLIGWLFIKNWMFCTVNAVLFDIKDFAEDSNIAMKTFVVRYGIRATILSILLPLLFLGVAAFLAFAFYRELSPLQIAINLVPFVLTMWIAYSLKTRRSILFYLIVIDGVLLVKALCGILATFLSSASS